MANEGGRISDDELEAYARLFDKPLLDCHVKAILALFGWDANCLPLKNEEVAMLEGQ